MICEHCGQEITEIPTSSLNITKVIETGASYFKIDVDVLKSRERTRDVVYPRQVIMSILSHETHLNLKQIGQLFNRDHTTVIYAKETVRGLAKVYPHVSDDIKKLIETVKQAV